MAKKRLLKSKKFILYFILILIFFINSYSTLATYCGLNSPQIATCTSSCSGSAPDRTLEVQSSSECTYDITGDPTLTVCCCPSYMIDDGSHSKCTYTYSWYIGGFSSCSTSCGTGTQTRDVYCLRSDGLQVADTYCPSPKPATSQSCTSYTGCIYSWYTSNWGACSSPCQGTQTRDVYCLRSDGTKVADSYCTATKPASSQGCNTDKTPSYFNSCDSTDGCGKTRETSPYNSCDLTSNTICGSETNCNDGVDNDCDSESDYDSKDGRRGDNNCLVSITSISATYTCAGEPITINCGSSQPNVNSIDAHIGLTKCAWQSWELSTAVFTCPGQPAGVYIVKCTVDTTKSHTGIGEKSWSISIPLCTGCPDYTNEIACKNDAQARCEWCSQCPAAYPKKYTGGVSRCVNKGNCPSPYCDKNAPCGAACDSSVANCDTNTCTLGCVNEGGTCSSSPGSRTGCCQSPTATYCNYGEDNIQQTNEQGRCCPDRQYWDGVQCLDYRPCSPINSPATQCEIDKVCCNVPGTADQTNCYKGSPFIEIIYPK